jgi:hypothetical protein
MSRNKCFLQVRISYFYDLYSFVTYLLTLLYIDTVYKLFNWECNKKKIPCIAKE